MAVQGDDVERHRGDVHSEPLGVGQQEAEGAAELPLPLQRVHKGEGEAQRVDQEVGWGRRRWRVQSGEVTASKTNLEIFRRTPLRWHFSGDIPGIYVGEF